MSGALKGVLSETAKFNALAVLKFGCFLHVMHEYVLEVTMCVGPSMLPTFNASGDIVLLERFSPRMAKLQRGDIVVARSPTNAKQTVCKRIKAMEGDEVTVNNLFKDKMIQVPKGFLWLEGDNPNNSTDSRHYGPIPTALVTGRVFAKVWPPTEMCWVEQLALKKKKK